MKWDKLGKSLRKYVLGGVVQPGEGSYSNVAPPMEVYRDERAIQEPQPTKMPSVQAMPEKFSKINERFKKPSNVSETPRVEKVQKFVGGGVAGGQATIEQSAMDVFGEDQKEKEDKKKVKDIEQAGGMTLGSGAVKKAPTTPAAQAKDAKKAGQIGPGEFSNLQAYQKATSTDPLEKQYSEKSKEWATNLGKSVAAQKERFGAAFDPTMDKTTSAYTTGQQSITDAAGGYAGMTEEQIEASKQAYQDALAVGSEEFQGVSPDDWATSLQAIDPTYYGKLSRLAKAQTGDQLYRAMTGGSQYATPGASRLVSSLIGADPEFQQRISGQAQGFLDMLSGGDEAAQQSFLGGEAPDAGELLTSQELSDYIKSQSDKLAAAQRKILGQETEAETEAGTEVTGLGELLTQGIQGIESETMVDPAEGGIGSQIEEINAIKDKITNEGFASLDYGEMLKLGMTHDQIKDFRSSMSYNLDPATAYISSENISDFMNTLASLNQYTGAGGTLVNDDMLNLSQAQINAMNLTPEEAAGLKALYDLAGRSTEIPIDESYVGKTFEGPTMQLDELDPSLLTDVQAKLDDIDKSSPPDPDPKLIHSLLDKASENIGAPEIRGLNSVDETIESLEQKYGTEFVAKYLDSIQNLLTVPISQEMLQNRNIPLGDLVKSGYAEAYKNALKMQTIYNEFYTRDLYGDLLGKGAYSSFKSGSYLDKYLDPGRYFKLYDNSQNKTLEEILEDLDMTKEDYAKETPGIGMGPGGELAILRPGGDNHKQDTQERIKAKVDRGMEDYTQYMKDLKDYQNNKTRYEELNSMSDSEYWSLDPDQRRAVDKELNSLKDIKPPEVSSDLKRVGIELPNIVQEGISEYKERKKKRRESKESYSDQYQNFMNQWRGKKMPKWARERANFLFNKARNG